MDKTVEVNFTPSNAHEYSVTMSFLVDLNRLEEGKISNLTIQQSPFITGWLKFGEKFSNIDNDYWIFNVLYPKLKYKDKVFLKGNLSKKEFKIIWKDRKPLKKLLESLIKKYPELIEIK